MPNAPKTDFDCALVGGGLQNVLIALAILPRPPDVRVKTESPLGLGGGMLLAAGIGLGLAALLRLLTWAVMGKWPEATLLGLGMLPLGYLALRAYRAFGRDRLHADAAQVTRKIFLPGYRFQLRLAVGASTQRGARRRLLHPVHLG